MRTGGYDDSDARENHDFFLFFLCMMAVHFGGVFFSSGGRHAPVRLLLVTPRRALSVGVTLSLVAAAIDMAVEVV